MADDLKRLTFAVPPALEDRLDALKKEMFYNRTKSSMIREFISAGLRATEEKNGPKNAAAEQSA